MKAPKDGWYWIKYRYRNTVNDPEEGLLSEWTPAWFDNDCWYLFGDECGINNTLVEEVGLELIYKPEGNHDCFSEASW